jgi:hypothetical protein
VRRDTPVNRELVGQQLESLDELRQWLLYESTRQYWREEATSVEVEGWYHNWAMKMGRTNGTLLSTGSFYQRLKGILGARYVRDVARPPGGGKPRRVVRLPPAPELAAIAVPGLGGLSVTDRNRLLDEDYYSLSEVQNTVQKANKANM